MEVIAKETGFYGCLRHPGDKFILKDEKDFSKRWMEDHKADAEPKKDAAPAKQPANPKADAEPK